METSDCISSVSIGSLHLDRLVVVLACEVQKDVSASRRPESHILGCVVFVTFSGLVFVCFVPPFALTAP